MMKHFKFLTMASMVPALLFTGAVDINAKEDSKQYPKVSTSLIEEPICVFEAQNDNNSETSTQRLEPIDECDGGGGGDPGPYRAPSTPTSIIYNPYTNGTQLTVSWPASNGYGYPVQYKLERRLNSGSWVQVYSGYGRSKTVSNLQEGKYQFRVTAKNTSYSSSMRYGGHSIVNPRTDDNLYNKYSFLSTLDQKNSQFRSSTAGAKTVLARAKVVGQSTSMTNNEERFYLGDGYDLVRGTLKETCLNVEHPQFTITKTAPLQPSTFDISYVNDNRHLAQLLEVSSSAQIGFSGDDFNLGLSGEKERYVKSVTDESHVRFVVKVNNRREYWKLNTPTDAIYPDIVNQILSPNDNEAKADFRERCGDNYVNSANLGSALYLVFTFDAKKYSYEERQSAKAELSIKLFDVFSAGGATSSSSSLTETLDRLEVKINADQVGGPQGLAASITPSNIAEKYNQFVQDTNPGNWAAVDYTTNNYQRPTIYNAYNHDQIFSKYTGSQGPLAQMKRWLDISVQHKERCDPWAEYDRPRPSVCGTSEIEISIAMDLCRETREWDNCAHPLQYTTGSLTTTTPGTNIYNWLSANVNKLEPAENNNSYTHHVHKGSINVQDDTCLPTNQCFANKFRGSGPGIGKGFGVNISYYDNPRGSHPTYGLVNDNYAGALSCARVSAFLKTGTGWFSDTTADLNYNIKYEGLCPQDQNFVIIP